MIFLDLLGPWLGHGQAMAPANQKTSFCYKKKVKNCKNPKYGLVGRGFVGPEQDEGECIRLYRHYDCSCPLPGTLRKIANIKMSRSLCPEGGPGTEISGHRKAHKHKGIFSGNGVQRFTGGSRPQGHLPRLISEGFGPVFPTIRDPRNIPLCAIPLCAFLAP